MQETNTPFDERNLNSDPILSEKEEQELRFWRARHFQGRGIAWSIRNRIPFLRTSLHEFTDTPRGRYNYPAIAGGFVGGGLYCMTEAVVLNHTISQANAEILLATTMVGATIGFIANWRSRR